MAKQLAAVRWGQAVAGRLLGVEREPAQCDLLEGVRVVRGRKD